MRENDKKKLKKEVIMTFIVILELVVIYVCIIAVKVNSDKESQLPESYGNNNTHSAEPVDKATSSPSVKPVTKETIKPTPNVTAKPKPSKKPSPTSNDTLGDTTKKLFADSVFLGDSRTEGLQLKTGLSSAKFITHRGLTVATAMTEKVIKLKNKEKGTVLDALKEGHYKKVYVMFGVNELGWPYTSTFKAKYTELIQEIQKIQPDAEIYVQSIIPVTKTKSDSSKIYNLKHVNKFNKTIKAMAKDTGVQYLNVQDAVTKTGDYLPEDLSTDGVHLNKEACFKWLYYLKDNLTK